ncbi:hypothetical protein F441_21407 [Phytophthora nicotianae CJ01A1]|uniref:Uncharacterized protein n=1 Tax=Phytophthora nicotianae CJ01A1 TaxID=1317063 RepID=W2VT18_PHYNI|nr:hypothetical protein F441_21407 [Phytophthora nicotianae CJ01A1]
MSETVSAKRRNQDLRKQMWHQGLPDTQIPLRERYKGKRKVYKLRQTVRPFHFLAQVVQPKGKWGITLKGEVSPLIPGIELVDSEAGNSGIDDYSRQNSDKTVTMDDVRRTISDDDTVEEAAVNFYLKDPKDVSTVVRIARGESGEHR